MRTTYLLAALPLTGLFAGNAFAQACTKPLALSNEIQMESSNGGPSFVPVKINGTDQKLTLATASASTQLSADTIKSMNLEASRDDVTIADFSMGRLHGTNVKWPAPDRGGRGGRGGVGGASSAGVFGQNYMRLYDLDVDFGNDKLRFFSQDHCPGGVLYWKAPGPVGVVPITIDNGRVLVPVLLNGKAINAVIDTASASSSVRKAVAEKVLGVELDGPKTPTGKTDFLGNKTWTWTTDGVAFGPLKLDAVLNVQADLNAGQGKDAANAVRARASGIQAELDHPEITIGMDLLRKTHAYFAFGENKLYIAQTDSTMPAATAATAAKAP
jgi:hypothetical protein